MTLWEAAGCPARPVTYSLVCGAPVLVGYMRISKADDSQTLRHNQDQSFFRASLPSVLAIRT